MKQDIQATPEDGAFTYHPSIGQAFGTQWDLTVGGQSLIDASQPTVSTDTTRTFEGFMKHLQGWARMGVTVTSDNPKATFWIMTGYGRSSISQPTFARQTIEATVVSGDTSHLIPLDELGGMVLHGQGTPIVCFEYDFSNSELVVLTQQHHSVRTHYTPNDGNSTGGHWSYMGISFPIDDHDISYWRDQLYPQGNYGGTFVHDDGTWVTESDFPQAVLAGGTHFHRDTLTWIEYTRPSEPWRDKATIRTADMQHLSVQDPLCQAYLSFPEDVGFRWLVEIAANRYLMQVPGWDKGTYRWDPGQARANGRVEKAATNLMKALWVSGQNDLANSVGIRAMVRLGNQIAEFAEDLRNGVTPWSSFEGRGKHSPAEIGIWWWGLNEVDEMLESVDVQIPELDYIKDQAARFVFDSFYLDAFDKAQLPYFVRTDWTHERIPSGGRHFGYLAARHANILGAAEEHKMERIEDLAGEIDVRFRM